MEGVMRVLGSMDTTGGACTHYQWGKCCYEPGFGNTAVLQVNSMTGAEGLMALD
jgi:hypothetical protein